MGQSLKSIPFFTDTITIVPHTGRVTTGYPIAQYFGREVSIREFCDGEPCKLDQVLDSENAGEYIITLANGDFLAGPEC